jgi:UDP-N-acetylmuramoyl-tripeptide--D-alanyl-D-alanine ligase
MTISVEAIAEAIGASIPNAADSRISLRASVSGYSIDSRTVNPGDCFFALRGRTNDGHDYVSKLPEKGAALAVVERLCDVRIAQLVVPDTLRALQQMAAWARQRWGGTVVGITGSAGKTTTKDAIASLLGVQFKTGRTIGNFNNHFGLPLSILRLPDDCRVAVLELGMNHAGEIRDLAGIAKPQIGVVTNVGWAHAEFFDDGIEGIARAKRELIEALPATGIAVLNADDEHVREFGKIHPGRTILYGFSEDAEVRAEDFRTCKSQAHFRCLGLDFSTPLVGRHGVSNVLAAIATARALNIAPERLQDAVKILAVGKMRGESFERDGITVINDSYNANPEATRSMLELLHGVPGRRKIAVLGEMLELGREAGTLHRGIGRLAAATGIDALVGIRGAASFMVEEAREAGMSGSAAVFFDTPEEAGIFLRSYLRAGDVVLFKGSRGVAVEKAIGPAFGDPPADIGKTGVKAG